MALRVDPEIEQIRRQIQRVHRLLYKLYRSVENATGQAADPLAKFDDVVLGARQEVAKVRDDMLSVVGQFPTQTTYLAIFVLLEVACLFLLILLVYKIVDGFDDLMKERPNSGRGIRRIRRKEQSVGRGEVWWQKCRKLMTTAGNRRQRPQKSEMLEDELLDSEHQEPAAEEQQLFLPASITAAVVVHQPAAPIRGILRKSPLPQAAAPAPIRRPLPVAASVYSSTNSSSNSQHEEMEQQRPLLGRRAEV